ncbi:cell wall-active antibiotics response protein LiaF [Paenibacillus sp. GCM10027626]|uniref:cell wall-active antibiotics response protein LiaF n=1 Tax=Paenibacillus sp. GCM10027626 TaxID=3273411 RepID=UPI0036350C04
MKSHFISRLMWGLFIILFGMGLLLRQAGWIDFSMGHLVSIFWPVLLIFLGFTELLKRMVSRQGSFWGGAVLLGVGLVFLGRNTGLMALSFGGLFRFIVPAVIIIYGLRMVFKPKDCENRSTTDDDGWQAYTSDRERPIPPAPPLHPDPTKPESAQWEKFEEQQPRMQQDPVKDEFERNHGDRFSSKQERMRQRAERIRDRMERHADKWSSRTNWWDYNSKTQQRSSFIGDVHVGQDYFELQPMNISHFIGDTVLDLTKAQIQPGETKITISSFIGDVKVFVPNDYEIGIQVVTSAFIGDVQTLDRKEGGMFKHMNIETPYYHETDKKVKLVVSTFIGDVRVTKVG